MMVSLGKAQNATANRLMRRCRKKLNQERAPPTESAEELKPGAYYEPGKSTEVSTILLYSQY